ncbi:hypothetical protein AB82_0903 [Escherichia coli 2-005-03_S3_C1]|nr:hypothetical protein AB82_0903 [Escherichia coli 2-005-03_S3_C1]KDW66189.1 hypothetical protein AC40_2669 [Escherichia coli 2-005-03_S3_C3]
MIWIAFSVSLTLILFRVRESVTSRFNDVQRGLAFWRLRV